MMCDLKKKKKKVTSVSAKVVYCVKVSLDERTDIRGSFKQPVSSTFIKLA